MYEAIKNSISSLHKEADDIDVADEKENAYLKLSNVKSDLENLDTNLDMDPLTEDDFNKLKDLVGSGEDLVSAYRNIVPSDIVEDCKQTIKYYEDALLEAIVTSNSLREYNANIEYIISNLSEIIDGTEYKLDDLI